VQQDDGVADPDRGPHRGSPPRLVHDLGAAARSAGGGGTMSRSVPITEDDVLKAVHELARTGVIPTLRAVHGRLGRGSLRTIHQHLLHLRQQDQIPLSPHPQAWVRMRLHTAVGTLRDWEAWCTQVLHLAASVGLHLPTPPRFAGIDTSDGELLIVLDESLPTTAPSGQPRPPEKGTLPSQPRSSQVVDDCGCTHFKDTPAAGDSRVPSPSSHAPDGSAARGTPRCAGPPARHVTQPGTSAGGTP
jgi:hypothetical protein